MKNTIPTLLALAAGMALVFTASSDPVSTPQWQTTLAFLVFVACGTLLILPKAYEVASSLDLSDDEEDHA